MTRGLTYVINTPNEILNHFGSPATPSKTSSFRICDKGISAQIVCCREHHKRLQTIMAVPWQELHETWEEAAAADPKKVIAVFIRLIKRRIKRSDFFDALSSLGTSECQSYWGLGDFLLDKTVPFNSVVQELLHGHS